MVSNGKVNLSVHKPVYTVISCIRNKVIILRHMLYIVTMSVIMKYGIRETINTKGKTQSTE